MSGLIEWCITSWHTARFSIFSNNSYTCKRFFTSFNYITIFLTYGIYLQTWQDCKEWWDIQTHWKLKRQHQRYLGVLLRNNNTANIVDCVLPWGQTGNNWRYACIHHLGAQPVGQAEGGLDLWLTEISFRKNSAYQRSRYPSIRSTDRGPRRSLNAHPQFMLREYSG